MTKEAATVFADALRLPPEDRRRLARELLASLGDDPEILESWLDEAEARAAEVDRGDAEAIPWSAARSQIFREE